MKHGIRLIIWVNTFFNLMGVNWRWNCIIKSTIYTNIVCLEVRILPHFLLFSHWTVITSFWEAKFIIRSVSDATITITTKFHMMILPIILTVTGWITSLTLIDQQIWRWWGWDITPITISCRKCLLLIILLKWRIRMRNHIRSQSLLKEKKMYIKKSKEYRLLRYR